MNSTERLARALGVSVDEARRRIEAAAYLGTTPTTVRRWINEGRVVLPSPPPAKVIPFRPREAGKGKAGRP